MPKAKDPNEMAALPNGGGGETPSPSDADEEGREERALACGLDAAGGDEDFYFESDHLALKANKDYLRLLKTLALLEAQKVQAVKDVDALARAREEAKERPFELVERLQAGLGLDLPGPIKVAQVPDIDWAKYDIQVPRERAEGERRKIGGSL